MTFFFKVIYFVRGQMHGKAHNDKHTPIAIWGRKGSFTIKRGVRPFEGAGQELLPKQAMETLAARSGSAP